MERQELIDHFNGVIASADTIYRNCAIAEAFYEDLSEFRKSFFAKLTEASDSRKVAQKELDAYASEEYVEFLGRLGQARMDYLKARAEVKAFEQKLNAAQSAGKLLAKEIEHIH